MTGSSEKATVGDCGQRSKQKGSEQQPAVAIRTHRRLHTSRPALTRFTTSSLAPCADLSLRSACPVR